MAGIFHRNKKSSGSSPRAGRRTTVTILVGLVIVFIPSLFLCFKTTSLVPTSRGTYLSQAEILRLQDSDKPVVLDCQGIDVLDIGASKGRGSSQFLTLALEKHGYKNISSASTLGIDIDPVKVDECNKNGGTCVQGNVLNLQTDNGTVSGVTAWHVLEHMPTCDLAKTMWHKASSIATGFSLFHGPSFDQSTYLHRAGFHRYYENWTGHSCHWDEGMMADAIETSPKVPTAYIVVLLKPFTSSASSIVLPNGAQSNSHHYNASVHPPKEIVTFHQMYYEEMRACAIYEPLDDMHLYTALALDDIFSAVKHYDGDIVRYYTGLNTTGCNGMIWVVGDHEECLSALPEIVANTISRKLTEEMNDPTATL